MNRSIRFVGLAGAVLIGASVSHAAVIQTNSGSMGSLTAYAASATDLVNAGQPTLLSRTESVPTPSYGSDFNALNNGTLGSPPVDNNLVNVAIYADGPWTTTFTLDTSVNTAGYDIGSISTISSWNDTRTNQAYTVKYTTVGDATPQLLGAYSYQPGQGGDNATRITLSNVGLIGVKSLSFTIDNVQGVYREIDVFAVPEPASIVSLLSVGSLMMMRRRRGN